MQLESTLFAVAVIQVKPQLEKVLNLPLDSLTKEVELTQDILNLFQEYQTSADLLSFDKDLLEYSGVGGDVKVPEMIKAVRANADKVMAMIKREEEKHIEGEKTHQVHEQAKVVPHVEAPKAQPEVEQSSVSVDDDSVHGGEAESVADVASSKKTKRVMVPNVGKVMNALKNSRNAKKAEVSRESGVTPLAKSTSGVISDEVEHHAELKERRTVQEKRAEVVKDSAADTAADTAAQDTEKPTTDSAPNSSAQSADKAPAEQGQAPKQL